MCESRRRQDSISDIFVNVFVSKGKPMRSTRFYLGVHDPGVHEPGVHELGVHELGVHELGVQELGVHELWGTRIRGTGTLGYMNQGYTKKALMRCSFVPKTPRRTRGTGITTGVQELRHLGVH